MNKIYGSEETLVEDKFGNFYFLKKNFEIDFLEEKIKTKKSFILDKNGNKYIFEDLIINLKNNEIAGKEIKLNLMMVILETIIMIQYLKEEVHTLIKMN